MLVLIIAVLVVLIAVYEANNVQNTGGQDTFVQKLAYAISKAENVTPAANNPGALTAADLSPSSIVGTLNDAGVAFVDTFENGWNALINKLQNIFNGTSSVYSPDMTISEFANTYTGGQNADAWAQSVASDLGVTPDTTLSDAAAQYSGGN